MSEKVFVTNREELDTVEVYQKAKAICEKYGYELWVMLNEVYEAGYSFPKLQVFKKIENKYGPDIFYSNIAPFRSGEKDYQFQIQTTSYGSLNMEEYPKFMKATENAYEMVKELSEIPVETWPCIKAD